MGLIEKFEDLFNKIIFKLLELIARVVPNRVKQLIQKIKNKIEICKSFLKKSPHLLREKIKSLILFLKEFFKSGKTTPSLITDLKIIVKEINEKKPKRSKIKNILLVPFDTLSFLFMGLNHFQVFLITALSIGSVMSIFVINQSVKDLSKKYALFRMPANTEEDPIYDRPDYYKKELRHVEITNLRLPVFFSEVNELKTVDIDFMITTSNRFSRTFIHKNDIQLRDHLLLHLEPIVPSLPLNDEGKEIIRKKLIQETNEFLKRKEVIGYVKELKITYILAN